MSHVEGNQAETDSSSGYIPHVGCLAVDCCSSVLGAAVVAHLSRNLELRAVVGPGPNAIHDSYPVARIRVEVDPLDFPKNRHDRLNRSEWVHGRQDLGLVCSKGHRRNSVPSG